MPALDIPASRVPVRTIRDSKSRPRPSRPEARLLSVSGFPADHKALVRMVDPKFWNLAFAHTRQEAVFRLNSTNVSVVLCERSLPDGTWKDVFECVEALPLPPLLVVSSALADDHLWSDVLSMGGYDVLMKPFAKEEVRRVLASASFRGPEYRHRTRAAGE